MEDDFDRRMKLQDAIGYDIVAALYHEDGRPSAIALPKSLANDLDGLIGELRWNLSTRSAYFRTRFGTPQAERTAP